MDHDERGCRVARIAKNIFEVEDVALAQAEVVTDPDGTVDMHRQMKPAALPHQITENVILKGAILRLGWHPGSGVFLVNRLRIRDSNT